MKAVVDADLASLLAKVHSLWLLENVFGRGEVCIVPGVAAELRVTRGYGYAFAEEVLTSLPVVALEPAEVRRCEEWSVTSTALGVGELESIAVCACRSLAFATCDRRARAFADARGVLTISLHSLLRVAWQRGTLDREQIERLIAEIEVADRTTVKNVAVIFATEG